MSIIPLREFKSGHRLIQTQVRLPKEIRAKAQALAEKESRPGSRISESDIYRTAILIFFSSISTDSRDGKEA